MIDISIIWPAVGVVGGIIGGVVGIYTLYEKIVKNRPVLTYTVLRNGVHNNVNPKNHEVGEAEVEVLIDIGNKGKGVLSVSGVFINSKERDYPIWANCEERVKKQEIRSFTLTEGKWKHLRLFYNGSVYKKDQMECELEIHLTGKKEPEKIPLTLHKGTTYSYGYKGPLDLI